MNVRIQRDTLRQIDAARGLTSRDSWVERACRLALHPAALLPDPDLVTVTHQHVPHQPSRTIYQDGVKRRLALCECGEEVDAL